MNAKSLELQITVAASNAIKVVSTLSDDFKKLAKSAAEFAGDSDDVKKTIDSLSCVRTHSKSLKFGANPASQTSRRILKVDFRP